MLLFTNVLYEAFAFSTVKFINHIMSKRRISYRKFEGLRNRTCWFDALAISVISILQLFQTHTNEEWKSCTHFQNDFLGRHSLLHSHTNKSERASDRCSSCRILSHLCTAGQSQLQLGVNVVLPELENDRNGWNTASTLQEGFRGYLSFWQEHLRPDSCKAVKERLERALTEPFASPPPSFVVDAE